MKKSVRVLLACVFLSVPSLCHADDWAGPSPRLYASEEGDVAMKVVPLNDPQRPRRATLTRFRLNMDGSEIAFEPITLVNVPMRVLIPDGSIGGFVTLDTHASLGFKHTLVIYNHNGQIVRDLKLEDFLSIEQIMQHVHHSASSRWWRKGATFSFEVPRTRTPIKNGEIVLNQPEQAALLISFAWGKKVRIKLATGEILTEPLPTPAAK